MLFFIIALVCTACGRRAVVLPTGGTPQHPDFIEPKVPPSLSSTPASNAQARAWQFLQAGDLRNAEREANVALKTTPDFFPATTTLAYLDLARRDARASIVKFDRALAHESAYAPALAGKGRPLRHWNREGEAVTVFEAALRSDPSLNDVARRLDVVTPAVGAEEHRRRPAGRSQRERRRGDGPYRDALERSPDSAFLHASWR